MDFFFGSFVATAANQSVGYTQIMDKKTITELMRNEKCAGHGAGKNSTQSIKNQSL